MNTTNKTSPRPETSLIGWLSLPLLVVLAYLFVQYVVPSMSPSAQDPAEGLLLGFVYVGTIGLSAHQAWRQINAHWGNRPVGG